MAISHRLQEGRRLKSDLNLIITKKFPPFSVSPMDSDLWSNLLVMEQVIGTLVKYGRSGNYEPYLAKSWTTSEDEKTWTFTLRTQIKTEDGKFIVAEDFAESLKKMLRIYARTSPPPTFSDLVGWKNFMKGNNEALGIKAPNSETLVFEFAKRPSGVLEFLSMPYFGFFSAADLVEKTRKAPHTIISSGAYRVAEIKDNFIVLEARKGWFSLDPESPQLVNISYQDIEGATENHRADIIYASEKGSVKRNGFYEINSTPTTLISFILSPYVEPFTDATVRRAFREVVRNITAQISPNQIFEIKSSYFYPDFEKYPLSKMPEEDAVKILKDLGEIEVILFKKNNGPTSPRSMIFFILSKLEEKLGWKIKEVGPEQIGKDWLSKASSNKVFPLRLTSVDIGGAPEKWVLDMMFCSQLGVSFPDVNNDICQILKNYESGLYMDTLTYWEAIHKSIEKHATVVPVGHWGSSWLVSDKIHPESISRTMNIPRFDLLKVQK